MVADSIAGGVPPGDRSAGSNPPTRLTAQFHDGEGAVVAVRKLLGSGIRVEEVYGPHPLHELDGVLGRQRSKLPWVTLAAGAFGGLSALGFQFYCAVFDWPINVGGKPANSTLAFVPITFELTVLIAGLATAAAFLLIRRLMPRLHPPGLLPRVTNDRFTLVIDPAGLGYDETEARRVLEEVDAERVRLEGQSLERERS